MFTYTYPNTLQILIAMMLIVTILSWTYMLRCSASIPGGAFGPTKLRPLLVIRGIAGFFGIWGFYVSLRYLALAEATLINFLAPVLATLLLGLLPGQQRCSMAQILAALVAVIGLLCVLQPWSAHVTNTPREHALAIGAALVGVLGGAVSFLTMSCLREHVHPITTVAYFAPICTLLSGTSLIIQRQGFSFPSTTVQWLYVCVLGVVGFAMHWLMAASLMTGDSKRALHIVYVQVVFAMLADKIVWGLEPGWWKYAGAVLIMGSAMFVAATKRFQGYTIVAGVDEEEKIETRGANH
jgi:drug/metabolite transporter (DMT)-like permease